MGLEINLLENEKLQPQLKQVGNQDKIKLLKFIYHRYKIKKYLKSERVGRRLLDDYLNNIEGYINLKNELNLNEEATQIIFSYYINALAYTCFCKYRESKNYPGAIDRIKNDFMSGLEKKDELRDMEYIKNLAINIMEYTDTKKSKSRLNYEKINEIMEISKQWVGDEKISNKDYELLSNIYNN